MSTEIFIITHKKANLHEEEGYSALQVGAAGHDRLPYLQDDAGDNISGKNPYYSELTGLYWIWKNALHTDNTGICHYRRYLMTECGEFLSEGRADAILKEYDIIVPRRERCEDDKTVREQFLSYHHEKDLLATREILAGREPDYVQAFDRVMDKKAFYSGNIMVMPTNSFADYCNWLFGILFAVEDRTDLTGYDSYQRRLYGFLAERLLNVYIEKNRLKTFEMQIGITADEGETNRVKEGIFTRLKENRNAETIEYGRKELETLKKENQNLFDVEGSLRTWPLLETFLNIEDRMGKTLLAEHCENLDELMHYLRDMVASLESLRSDKEESGRLDSWLRNGITVNHLYFFLYRMTKEDKLTVMQKLADEYEKKRCYREALDCYDKLLLIDGSDLRVRKSLARFLHAIGEDETAQQFE